MRTSLRHTYHRILCLLPPARRVQFHYLRHHRRLLDLRNPRTYTEKIQYRKLYGTDESMSCFADKIVVKEFVKRTIGSEWVIPTLYWGLRLPPRDKRDWTPPYVIKASHGSSMNIFVRTQEEANWPLLEPRIASWLRSERFAGYAAETVYQNLTPKVLIEPFIGDRGRLPFDYKLHVFDGRVEFVQVDTDRESDHKRTIFDRNWNRMPFSIAFPTDDREIPAPTSLDKLIDAAETLAKPFSYIRVDFYEVNESPLFGEMTFYPDSGFGRISPQEYDMHLGELWQLPI